MDWPITAAIAALIFFLMQILEGPDETQKNEEVQVEAAVQERCEGEAPELCGRVDHERRIQAVEPGGVLSSPARDQDTDW